jgi:GT2 family glycosyltransferase
VDVVVVDNWSNEAQLRDLRAGLPAGVTLVENALNLGYSAGNNTGLRAKPSSAEYALVVNNDTVLGNPRTLEQLVNTLKGSERYAACSPLVRDAGCGVAPERSIQVRRIPDYWQLLVVSSSVLRRLPGLRRVFQRQVYADRRPFPLDSVVECETINGCCFLIRTDVLEAIGYLDEGTFLYCEELILGLQLRARGLGCALVTHSCVDHEQGASAGRNAAGATLRGMLRRIRSEVYFARNYLHCGGPALLLIRVVGLTDVLLKAVLSVFRSQSET